MFDVTMASANLTRNSSRQIGSWRRKPHDPVWAMCCSNHGTAQCRSRRTDIDLQSRVMQGIIWPSSIETAVTLTAPLARPDAATRAETEVRFPERPTARRRDGTGVPATLATLPALDFRSPDAADRCTDEDDASRVPGLRMRFSGSLYNSADRRGCAVLPEQRALGSRRGHGDTGRRRCHRLALAEWPAPEHSGHDRAQAHKLDALLAECSTGTGQMSSSGTARTVCFSRSGIRVLVSRTIDGKFPDWRAFCPRRRPHWLRAKARWRSGPARRAGGGHGQMRRRTVFALTPNALTMSASAAAVGDGERKIALAYDGRRST